ncbi:aldolase/citrate lyase family protein, partial [Bacteroidota bacterium]
MNQNIKTGQIAEAGNKGDNIRSDCFISLEIKTSGGIDIDLQSKVKVMYGEEIISQCKDILSFFDIKNTKLSVLDSGALSFTIAARLEFAIKQLIETEKDYLPEMLEGNSVPTAKEQFRFSRLYLPGNTPSMMINAGIHKPNGIILDLEDAVAPAKKEEARYLVRNALRQVNFYGAERMVRINQVPKGLDDLEFIVPHRVNLILVPKCESAGQIQQVVAKINELSKKHKLDHPIWLMPIIESALGVERAFEIASSSHHIVAMAIGLEDFTADLGVKRTKEATESLYARQRLINAAKAAGIQPIDSVFSDVGDMEGLAVNVKMSKTLGFEGMGCIHPRQIKV